MMSIFTTIKARFAVSKLASEKLYEMAVEEIASGNIRTGLWAKAVAETGGDEAAANARYLKLRVDTMKAQVAWQIISTHKTRTPNARTQKLAAKPKRSRADTRNGELKLKQRSWLQLINHLCKLCY